MIFNQKVQMPRPKRNSRVLASLERQLESMQSIDLNLDFNNGITTQAYADLIDQMQQTDIERL
jgi:hypothetical protein